jgi:DNA-binding transcriptional regulator YiaG
MEAIEFKERLQKLGLKQVDFARFINTSTRGVQNWTMGSRKIPETVDTILYLIDKLPTSEAWEIIQKRIKDNLKDK